MNKKGAKWDNKEIVKKAHLIGLKGDKLQELAKIVWTMGRSSSASVVYCNAWFWGDDVMNGSGRGNAGGGGYCKISASFAEAVDNAGFDIWQDETKQRYLYTSGSGESAVRGVLEQYARQCGVNIFIVIGV